MLTNQGKNVYCENRNEMNKIVPFGKVSYVERSILSIYD